MRSDDKASLSFVGIGAALLVSGAVYYLALRTARPGLLERLHVKPLAWAGSVEGNAFLGSLPSLIHVTAFGLLTCALFRPTIRSAAVAGAAWASLGVLWELSCADQQAWLRLGGQLIGVGYVPACTYDRVDIAASAAGVAVAACIACLVRKFIPPHSIAQEQRT